MSLSKDITLEVLNEYYPFIEAQAKKEIDSRGIEYTNHLFNMTIQFLLNHKVKNPKDFKIELNELGLIKSKINN